MAAANTIVQAPPKLKQRWIAVKMENAVRKAMMAKSVAKAMLARWIAAKMENAACPGMMEKIVARHRINHYQTQ